jgi:predicted metalloprotease with PDZ domain
LKDNSYVLEVVSPSSFERTAALPIIEERTNSEGSVTTTRYAADRYFEITDNPMMFGDLDVEEFQVGDIKIVLSVFSPNGKHSARHLKETMYKMMEAQKAYLGSVNSTKRYDIYLYLADNTDEAPGGFGALEHHTSTVVVMAESMSEAGLDASMIDVVSHEFFHILTPLSVHSEDVHYFDYHDPSFSKHLWMYEGLTEYFATHFQVNQGLVDEDEFYGDLMQKIQTAASLNDTMSFTEMSENILEQPYASNYYNVYQKGALIGMCLDIIIREQSGGERGILSVMKELSEKYGVDKPFEDESIIEEITAMTYPEVGAFFKNHVIGGIPIDYNAYFEKVGLGMIEGRIQTNYIMNNGALILKGRQEDGTIFFSEAVAQNSFWHENGVLPGDVVKEIDGTVITLENANAVVGAAYGWAPGQKVEVKLDRDGEEIIIAKELTPSYTVGRKLGRKEEATEKELELLEAWLKG